MGIMDFFKKKTVSEPAKPEYVVPAKPLVQIADAQVQKPVQEMVQPQAKPTTKATKLSANGVKCIIHDEGFRKKPYLDTKNVPTIGYGTTYYPDGRRVTLQDPFITEEQGIEYMMFHVANRCQAPMAKLIKVDLNQNQYDALTSFVYNAGEGNLATSTMLKLINQGKFAEAAAEFPKWNKSGGKVEPGLVKRRERERELFERPMSIA